MPSRNSSSSGHLRAIALVGGQEPAEELGREGVGDLLDGIEKELVVILRRQLADSAADEELFQVYQDLTPLVSSLPNRAKTSRSNGYTVVVSSASSR